TKDQAVGDLIFMFPVDSWSLASKRQDERKKLFQNCIDSIMKKIPIMESCRSVKYLPLDLYPSIPLNSQQNPIRPPTAIKVQSAYAKLQDFHLFREGYNVIQDTEEKSSIIALIEFTEFKNLSDSEIENLQFLSTFLHRPKEFLGPVSPASQSWGGLMWALGWRKSRDKNQIAGRYIKKFPASKMSKFNSVFRDSPCAGEILGKLFQDMANKYKHCTMPSDPNPVFTRLGISLQINRTLANACQNYEDGHYDADEYYFGDHYYYLFHCLVKNVTLICCSMIFIFQ
ncbi:hypothetical protein VP01_1263g1, partial [Puccinia sorghi]